MRDAIEPVRGDDDDVDDSAGMLAVAPTLGRGLHHVPGAVQIGVDDGVPAFYREIDRGLRKLSAGAVDETVNLALCAPDRIEQRVDRVRLPDVGDISGCAQVPGGQVGDEGVEPGLIAPDHGDMGA